VHMLLWLVGSPNADEMNNLLQGPSFRQRIITFIQENIRSHLDAFGIDEIRAMRAETALPYSRPPNPDDNDWLTQVEITERCIVRSHQIHTCTRNTCLVKRHGDQIICKRRAPWDLYDNDMVDSAGNWHSKRTFGYLNSYCPMISING
jgi:hypothetical protein